jgi:hypothetical protein
MASKPKVELQSLTVEDLDEAEKAILLGLRVQAGR